MEYAAADDAVLDEALIGLWRDRDGDRQMDSGGLMEQLIERIHECLEIDSMRREKQVRHNKYSQHLAQLTPREYEVMELMVSGKMNKVIAADLDISQRTVEDHRAKVLEKLQAKSIADVVRFYLLSQY